MISLPYVPKHAIARDLRDYIFRSQERARAFNFAVAAARAEDSGGLEEMNAEKIYNTNDYIWFVDEMLRWTPDVSSPGDAVLRKLLVFYWIFEQPSIRNLQTAIHPETSATDLKWLSYWLVSFARELGHFMETPESAKAIKSFYENPIYNKDRLLWQDPPSGGWKSFNEWFSREWKDINTARPLAGQGKDSVIVHGADSMFDGHWDIVNGIVDIEILRAKGIPWPISKLLQFAGSDYNNGGFMHAFLSPHDYHRQHAPVSGKVIRVDNIQDQVYLQVMKKRDGSGLAPGRGIIRDPQEVARKANLARDGEYRRLDAPDDAGYQWCQTRGLIEIQTGKYGKVAVLPIGMAQVSSVMITVKKDDTVQKGDNISYFQFGGSDIVIVFEKKVKFRDDLVVGETKLNVREKLADFV
ncbi:phosphatidylserine decarboxylase-domain-containing protein [Aspergillus cavernicola]|uniref:Phosphatidylserine decarboxylase-domain-containing protein n=1 Tax=Aspergillus cavernicola TaxID=176166 RepID=A0ABR4IJ36_9EURO